MSLWGPVVGLLLIGIADPLAIVGGKICIGNGMVLKSGTVLIRGEKIVQVGTRVRIPKGADIVRAEDKVVIAGVHGCGYDAWASGVGEQ